MLDRFYYLVSKKLTGEASDAEKEELSLLLSLDEELNALYKSLFERESKVGNEDDLTAEQAYAAHAVRLQVEEEFERGFIEHKEYLEEAGSKEKSGRRIYLLAACFIAVMIVSGLLLFNRENSSTSLSKNEVVTKKGSKTHITLPDGTSVWLNSDSKLTYEGDFRGKLREVTLIGEGFFDVVKNKKRPFIIHTNALDVKVLGTAFNVRSYPEEKMIETSLIHGSIEVTLKEYPDQKILLRPSEKLIVSNLNTGTAATDSTDPKTKPKHQNEPPVLIKDKIHFQQDSISVEASWKENKLVFDNELFSSAALKIERWFNVELVIKSERINNLRFTGTFGDKSLKDVLEALQVSRPFHYTINDAKVIIW